MKPGYLRNLFLISAIILLSFFLLTFIFRDLIVSAILSGKIEQFNERYHAGLKVEKVRMKWLTTVVLTGISLKREDHEPLFRADTLEVSVNGWKLLAGRITLQRIGLYNASLCAVRQGKTDNYSFLLKDYGEKRDTVVKPVNFAYAVDRLTTFIFDKIPKNMDMRRCSFSLKTNGHAVDCFIERFSMDDHQFSIPVRITENDTTSLWRFSGQIDHRINQVESMIYLPEKSKAILPFIRYKYHAFAEFDTVFFRLGENRVNDTLTCLSGKIYVKGFAFNHRRISPDTVLLDKLDISYSLNIGRDYAEMDSISRISVNELEVNPFVRYKTRPSKLLTLKISKPPFPAQDLFSSLPAGLFTNLQGIRVSGEFSYELGFFADLSNPDSLLFLSDLKGHKFRLLSLGNNDLVKINGPFLYTAYEKGVPVRIFMVGPENPNFRPISRVTPFLVASVLTSEDPSFFQHGGFIMDAFRESLIQDIKERKFARGGSTISMQLVKNVFLSRNKTIARKLEEILIVWLIENQRLISKERMFEVYMNIIEWGPLIYGANEASRFYFNKDVSKLTLAESIFLASIIPRPKWFRYSFDETGHLRASQADYFRLLSGKMLNRGLISQQDFDHLVPDVELKGPARMMLKKGDTVPADTVAE